MATKATRIKQDTNMVVTVGFTDAELNLGMEVAESCPQLSLWALKAQVLCSKLWCARQQEICWQGMLMFILLYFVYWKETKCAKWLKLRKTSNMFNKEVGYHNLCLSFTARCLKIVICRSSWVTLLKKKKKTIFQQNNHFCANILNSCHFLTNSAHFTSRKFIWEKRLLSYIPKLHLYQPRCFMCTDVQHKHQKIM